MVRYPDRIQVRVPLDDPEDQASLRRAIARETGCSPESLPDVRLIRRAIDARGSRIWLNLELDLGPSVSKPSRGLQPIRGEPKTLIVGDGPAGLFCAYELALSGQSSLVIDRGKKVQPRRRDLKLLNQFGEVPADSNYCFGEGGAGTYSDGKLYTRSQKRGDPQAVLDILAYHGAPAQILTDARPHIGSNKLPKVITSMREALEDVGIQFRFETRVEGLKIRNGRCVGVRIAGGEVILAENIVIATGHSAVDVFHFLDRAGVALEAKPFAVGVRIEHPQPLIDRLQYKTHAGHPKLPAASYKLAAKIDHRSVYSFCMCPGGWIVPSSTSADGLVVNGMSLSRRDSPFANSGLVVNVTPADL
ncbi:MAG: FAD-dependent protein, partial [Myxococcota bacterium]